MMNDRPVSHYGTVARWAHWLVAALVISGFSIGLIMTDMERSPLQRSLFSVHKSIGVTVFLLMLLRLGWRLRNPPPALPTSMPSWQRQTSEIWHRMLYLLLIAVPLSGWLMSSAHGGQTVYLNLLPIPDLLSKDRPLGAALEEVHYALNMIMAGFVVVHVLAALKHQFVDHDGILDRMWLRRAK